MGKHLRSWSSSSKQFPLTKQSGKGTASHFRHILQVCHSNVRCPLSATFSFFKLTKFMFEQILFVQIFKKMKTASRKALVVIVVTVLHLGDCSVTSFFPKCQKGCRMKTEQLCTVVCLSM